MEIWESLPPRGAWIEMGTTRRSSWLKSCRSPRGERGLKSHTPYFADLLGLSLPPRGAWIEMFMVALVASARFGRSPRGERGLKCAGRLFTACGVSAVAPPAGSVD